MVKHIFAIGTHKYTLTVHIHVHTRGHTHQRRKHSRLANAGNINDLMLFYSDRSG